MNYRHAFHAGSFADVVKHTVLLQLLEYLQKKPTPYCFIDTHAGEGAYDLSSDIAQKTNEAFLGVGKLLNAKGVHPASLDRYLTLIQSYPLFPGSPLIAAKVMRPIDRVILNEKHPNTYQQLKNNLKAYKNIAIHQRDAYEFLTAMLPPKEQRGLVFIDPAFEDDAEMEYLQHSLEQCYKRWPQGLYLIWLPIVGRSFYTARDLQHSGFENYLTIEFCVNIPSSNAQGLIGSTLLLINPPWQIEKVLTPMLDYLWQVLHEDAKSRWSLRFGL